MTGTGTTTIENCLIENNVTSAYGSIVAGNFAGDNCDAVPPVTSSGHNIAGDSSCNLTETTDHPETDPLLDVLADNGGNTLSHRPLDGSPAIDGGDPDGCSDDGGVLTADQRGFPRPVDGNGDGSALCDIGALERDACGDGTVQSPEACDDGNTADGDGCDADCREEVAPEPEEDTDGDGSDGGGGCSLLR